MSQLITKYQRAIDQLPLAAKSIILAVILSLIFVIWYTSFWQNVRASLTSASDKIKTLEQSTAQLEKQLKKIVGEAKTKSGAKNFITTKTLTPHQTTSMLQDILKNTSGLVLLQLDNLPPKAVMLPQSNSSVFEHGIVIKFRGNYLATMHYLQSIETLKWKIFWDKLEYKVIQYPMAEITLYIHTISNEEDWIHV